MSELNKFLFWCQQLIAESLGKGKGLFPVISTVPKDHHSLLQHSMAPEISCSIFLV